MYRPKPWAYLYDVVAYILNRLDKHNQILHCSFILTREIQIKIGRDHGDTIVTQILWLGISDGVQRRSANYVEQSLYFDHVTLMVH